MFVVPIVRKDTDYFVLTLNGTYKLSTGPIKTNSSGVFKYKIDGIWSHYRKKETGLLEVGRKRNRIKRLRIPAVSF